MGIDSAMDRDDNDLLRINGREQIFDIALPSLFEGVEDLAQQYYALATVWMQIPHGGLEHEVRMPNDGKGDITYEQFDELKGLIRFLYSTKDNVRAVLETQYDW
ncbi:MAG: hypothetical protein ABIH34_05340 [Nanoarchaeota archaeon]